LSASQSGCITAKFKIVITISNAIPEVHILSIAGTTDITTTASAVVGQK
jgi:hypothetical protein